MSDDKRVYRNDEPGRGVMDTAKATDRPESWSRRRFGAAAVATSVVVGLHSNPLRADKIGGNCTPSGWVSGNASVHGEAQDCKAHGPEDWSSQRVEVQGQWQNWPLHSQFKLSHHPTVDRNPATFGHAVSDTYFDATSQEVRELLKFGAAAFLNARFATYPLSESEVQGMVSSACNRDPYRTRSGDLLEPEQVLMFLKNTMGHPRFHQRA